MSSLKTSVKKILPKWMIKRIVKAKAFFFDDYVLKSYSQEGEDIILRRIFEQKKSAFMLMLEHVTQKDFRIHIFSTSEVGGELMLMPCLAA